MRIAPGGVTVAAVPAAIGVIAAVIGLWPAAVAAGILAGAVLVVYRDPDRSPAGAGIIAPADGTVREVYAVDGRVALAIFLNLHHVHVVRAPAAGRIERLDRVDGHRRPAFLSGAVANAGVEVTTDGWTTTLRAGAVARRVRPYVDPGDDVARGERLGHIAFGSRVDVTLPPSVDRGDLTVAPGDRVRAGQTVVAETGQ